MAALMGQVPITHYEMNTEADLIEAQGDIINKACGYLIRRLALYRDNMRSAKENEPKFANGVHQPSKNQLITKEGWETLFHAEPLAHGRRVCSYLYVVVGSTDDFWRGCSKDGFAQLRAICTPTQAQPPNLLGKYYLFYDRLFAYLDYIATVVQQVSWYEFNERSELKHFLDFLVSTQFLLCDLLDFETTPIGKQRNKLREYAATLHNSVDECAGIRSTFHDMWRHSRGELTSEFVEPDEECKYGHFFNLGGERLTAG